MPKGRVWVEYSNTNLKIFQKHIKEAEENTQTSNSQISKKTSKRLRRILKYSNIKLTNFQKHQTKLLNVEHKNIERTYVQKSRALKKPLYIH